jgi:hypothetical protein
MPDSLTIIRQEIAKGHVVRARKILRILLEETPTAPLWYLASTICESREQELGCLRQALKIDPNHLQARERYIELKKPPAPPQEMPPLITLVEDLPEPASVSTPEPDPFTAKQLHRKRSQRRWTMVGLAASLIMSISSTYFLLTVLGSPIPAQIRAFVSGQSGNDKAGKPVFGTQTGSGQLNTPTAPMPPVSATQENYSAEAVAGGFMVRPNKTEDLQAEKPVNDVLDPGFAHEYVIKAKQGEELAIAVQFFSPTAHKVAANMGILDPDGYNAASQCERGAILTDGSSVTYICKIHKSGNWKVQLFGHSGESTGVYVLTYQRM